MTSARVIVRRHSYVAETVQSGMRRMTDDGRLRLSSLAVLWITVSAVVGTTRGKFQLSDSRLITALGSQCDKNPICWTYKLPRTSRNKSVALYYSS